MSHKLMLEVHTLDDGDRALLPQLLTLRAAGVRQLEDQRTAFALDLGSTPLPTFSLDGESLNRFDLQPKLSFTPDNAFPHSARAQTTNGFSRTLFNPRLHSSGTNLLATLLQLKPIARPRVRATIVLLFKIIPFPSRIPFLVTPARRTNPRRYLL